MPDHQDRLAILRVHARDKPLAAGVDLEGLARTAEGFSGADLEGLCREAGLAAIRDSLAQSPAPPLSAFQIRAEHFDRAFQRLSAKT